MQACVYEEYGPPEVVRLAEVAAPEIGRDELLVQVRAAAVTSADYRFRASAFPSPFWLAGRLMLGLLRPRNAILGMDFSGVVVAVGERVTRFRVGDRVLGATSPMRRGAHAEYLAVRESDVVVKTPEALGDHEAAAIPFGACSALWFLREVARLEPDQRLLIVGASGSVGSWAVQLGRLLGAEVTGVSSGRNLPLLRSLGAHRALDYAAGPLGAGDGDQKYDVIFDTVGVTTFAGCRHALTRTGQYLPLNSGLLEMAQALLTSFGAGRRVRYSVSQSSREALEQILGWIHVGAVRPVVDRVYPLAEVVAAHRHVESRHKRGSVVLAMGSG